LSEPVHVRAVQRADFPQWSDLWDGYNTFYGRAGETALAPEVTRTTWSRFFDAYEPMHALVAEVAGRIVGLTHFLYHRSTIQIPPTCYLADLYHRGCRARSRRRPGVSTQRVKPQSLGNPPSHWRC
jgi:hypothetical protein